MSYSSGVSHRSYFPIPPRWLRRALPLAFVILSFGIRYSALAHPADQSEMRVRPQPHQLEIRLTFNILTLTRFTGIDADGDMKISMAELTAAQPRIATYLNKHIHLEINRQKAMLGTGVRFEMLWPDASQTPPMPEPEYAARNVDVTFVQAIEDKLLEDFWLGFEIFEQTGPMQTVHGVITQDGRNEDITFTAQQPEYLYDTGYAEDPFVQSAEKKRASRAAPPPDAEPMPSAVSAPAPAPAAPPVFSGATAAGKPHGAAQSSPAGKPSAALATPIDPVAEPPPSTERWWMIRAAVIIIMLVVGRKLQLSARAHRVSSRRRPRSR